MATRARRRLHSRLFPSHAPRRAHRPPAGSGRGTGCGVCASPPANRALHVPKARQEKVEGVASPTYPRSRRARPTGRGYTAPRRPHGRCWSIPRQCWPSLIVDIGSNLAVSGPMLAECGRVLPKSRVWTSVAVALEHSAQASRSSSDQTPAKANIGRIWADAWRHRSKLVKCMPRHIQRFPGATRQARVAVDGRPPTRVRPRCSATPELRRVRHGSGHG